MRTNAQGSALRAVPTLGIGAVLAAFLLAACARGASTPCAVLITLDTTRADALGCLGGRSEWSPNLDALARESVLYTAARTVAPQTMPAHASMFTGLYPPRHGVRDNNLVPLPAAAETVAELARAAGLRTGAFVSSIGVDRAFGFDQGFESWNQPPTTENPVPGNDGTRLGKDTVQSAIAWLGGLEREEPFFLWVHLFDPHKPYAPPEEFRGRAPGDPYHGEVAAMDAAVGELLAELRKRGALERALVLVVADHGEGLGDHGEDTHGAYCYDSTIRVPFLVRYPDARRAGERSAEPVSVVDVYPTLLEFLGLSAPADHDGLSLLGPAVAPERGVYFESFLGFFSYGWSPLSGWADRDGIYLHASAPLVIEPGANADSARPPRADEAERVARCVRAIGEIASRPALPQGESVKDAMLDSLRGLGYASVGVVGESIPGPLDVEGKPSPQERVAEHQRTLHATNLYILGRARAAIPLFKRLLEENPENLVALEGLGTCLVLEGRWREALEPWRRLVAKGSRGARAPANLAVVLLKNGEEEEAERWLRAALVAEPGYPRALEQLLKLVEARGEHEEAAELRARLAAARR